jgi:hypothetical protein
MSVCVLLLSNVRWVGAGTGAGMIKTLRRSLRSFGRSGKKAMDVGSDEGADDPLRPSEAAHLELCRSEQGFEYKDHSTEFGKCYFSDSSRVQGFRHSFQGFRRSSGMSSPRGATERADMFMLKDRQPFSPAKSQSGDHGSFSSDSDLETPRLSKAILAFEPEDLLIPGWPLMHHAIGFDIARHSSSLPSPQHPLAPSPPPQCPVTLEEEEEEEKPSAVNSRTPENKVKSGRSPLHRMFSLKKSPPSQLDRQTSILDWALKLPSRSKEPPKSPTSPTTMTFAEEVYAKLLQEIALDAFRADSDHATTEETSSQPSVETGLTMTDEEKEEVTKAGKGSLVHTLDSLCSDRKCITFLYEELEAGTSNFSSSKSYTISCKCSSRADYYYGAGRDLEVVLCR